MILSDAPSERAILAGVCRYHAEGYYDVADLVDESSFTIPANSIIFTCLKKVMQDDDTRKIDVPSILSAAGELGFREFFGNAHEIEHLSSIMRFPITKDNIRKFAVKLRKLHIARQMYEQLELTKEKYTKIKGDEPISHILGIAEESIFDFMSALNDSDDSPKKVFEDAEERLNMLAENPVDQVGIPTGFDRYDFAIGGGLRPGTVNVIGARAKIGKSLLTENMGIYIAKEVGVPVLVMDTEMRREDQQDRGMAMISYDKAKVEINEIETGRFVANSYKEAELRKAVKEHKNIPYYHKNIGGRPFEDQLSIMRRWLAREVGIDDTGKAKPCVIIYDYLKLMESSEIRRDLSEFQALGFMMTALHNFTLKYNIPILCFIQLNRDGITKESTDTASGSDRIIWLCSNYTIYKPKSDEEIAKDGPENGNRKLVPVIARHGEGLDDKDYINVIMKGKYGKLIEGKTAFELEDGAGYEDGEDEDDVPF